MLDFDIKGFFDNIDHALMLGAVRKHTDCPWVLLYIERWLQAPGVDGDGQRIERNRGTPQGGVISPLLANIFLHHVLDKWMADRYPSLPFERYADDMIVHCRSERQARLIRHRIEERLQRCKLELHPQKTKIVFCKKNGRSGSHENVSFDFLGFTFQPRMARSRDGELFLSFLPAISERAATAARRAMRDWGLQRRSERSLEELARMYGAKLRGWIEYWVVWQVEAQQGLHGAQQPTGPMGSTEIQAVPAVRRDRQLASSYCQTETRTVPALGGRVPAVG